MTTTILTQHYQALEQSNDEVTRQLAEVQLAKLHYAQPPTLVPNGVQHNRWSHVPLEQLFAEAGNTVHQNDRGYQCGHQPVHSSESGKCIHIKSENGYWYCHSCQQGGDAVAAVKSLQGLSIQDAITYLTQHFGPPHLPQKALPHITSAPELLAKEFPTLQWAVEGLLPEGCSICAARPKKGKSFLALGLCIAVAGGVRALGSLKVTQGDVLYLALEDGPRRLQARLCRMLNGVPSPQRLYFATEWPRHGEGGEGHLREWLAAHPDARLVVVDTLKRIRPAGRGRESVYDTDYDAIAPLTDVAREFHVALLVIHHTRKSEAEDIFDTVSGSLGLTGAADAVWVLKRERGAETASLHIIGRDVEEAVHMLNWDAERCSWSLVNAEGSEEEQPRSPERQTILVALHDGGEPLTPKQLAERTGRAHNATKKLLRSMVKDREVKADEKGRYTPLVPRPHAASDSNSGNSGNSDDPDGSDSSDTSDEPDQGTLERVTEGVTEREVVQRSAETAESVRKNAALETTQEGAVTTVTAVTRNGREHQNGNLTELATGRVEVSPSFDVPAFTYITEPARLAEVLPQILASPLIAIDTETTDLDPHTARLRLVQVSTLQQTVVIDAYTCDVRALSPLFDGGRDFIIQNGKFDLQFFAHAGLPLPTGHHLFDTMLAAQLLGAGTEAGNLRHCGLEKVAHRYLGVVLDKTLQTSDWTSALSEEQLRYAARDAAVLLPLAEKLRAEIAAAQLERVTAIEMRACPALAWMELNSAPIDIERWRERADSDLRRAIELKQLLDAFAGVAVNWQSPVQVLKMLQARGHKIGSTDETTLLPLIQQDELVDLLLQYRDAMIRANTYGVDWLAEHINEITGRIHADFIQLGAVTGRMACSRPNLQSIPRGPLYRTCFHPEEGWVVVKADYSQIESRLVAVVSRDPLML